MNLPTIKAYLFRRSPPVHLFQFFFALLAPSSLCAPPSLSQFVSRPYPMSSSFLKLHFFFFPTGLICRFNFRDNIVPPQFPLPPPRSQYSLPAEPLTVPFPCLSSTYDVAVYRPHGFLVLVLRMVAAAFLFILFFFCIPFANGEQPLFPFSWSVPKEGTFSICGSLECHHFFTAVLVSMAFFRLSIPLFLQSSCLSLS